MPPRIFFDHFKIYFDNNIVKILACSWLLCNRPDYDDAVTFIFVFRRLKHQLVIHLLTICGGA